MPIYRAYSKTNMKQNIVTGNQGNYLSSNSSYHQPLMNISHHRNYSKEDISEFTKPNTQYTKSGSINIAYQVFGSGPIDLVYIPGWVSNIDCVWSCPELVSFLQELGKFARVILFDKRGTGLSDRLFEISTLEERMDDIRAVMDAADSPKAILFGHSEGGCVSALFAATYPNRVISLIAFGIFAKRRYTPDYPWAPTDEERQKVYDMIENNWGNSGEMGLEKLAPSKINDKRFMDWLASYFRSGASPGTAMMLTKMNTQIDITNILSAINVPTLIMQRTNDIDVNVEEGRFIASRVRGAKFIELEGDDHLFWVGDMDEILSEMKGFIADNKPDVCYEKQLLTIIVARSNTRIAEPNDLITKVVNRYRGEVFQSNQFTLIATFEGPGKAVHCSIDLMEVMKRFNVQLAIGIHIQEISLNEAAFMNDEITDFADSVVEKALPNQILLTQTVKHLLSGTGFEFLQQDSIFQTPSGDSLHLFEVNDPDHFSIVMGMDNDEQKPVQKDSFFETVLQCIDEHIEENLTVDMLCKYLGTSERQLQRKLKNVTHKAPSQLISSVRMHRAKELLIQQNRNVSEVAFQIGFSSPSYFSKKFKMEFGVSPSCMTSQLTEQK